MNTLEQREQLINEELAQLAYEQRKLEEYKQKEGANDKAVAYQQKVIDERLYRFNQLNFIYDDIEKNFNIIIERVKSRFQNVGIHDIKPNLRIIIFRHLISETEKEIKKKEKEYQEAQEGSIKELTSAFCLTVHRSVLRDYTTGLNMALSEYNREIENCNNANIKLQYGN